jgi:hypothetical protein
MWIDATIAFGGIFLLGVAGFTLHWWLGRDDGADTTRKRPGARTK